MAKELGKERMCFFHKMAKVLSAPRFNSYSATSYLLLLQLVVCLCFFSTMSAGAENKQRVLILHSYHVGYPWSDRVTEGVMSVLGKEKNVEIFFEHMDTKRHIDKPYLENLLHLYQTKYESVPLDVIICSDDNALNFLLSNRGNLFTGVPIVFCGINNFTDSLIAGHSHITGVVENPDILGTLQIALRLHPKSRQVVVVHDQTKSALANAERMRKIASDFEEKVEFKYLTNMKISELREALRALSSKTIVLHLTFARDRDGVFLSIEDASKLVNDNSAGPVYTCWDVRMKYPGHCGGKVVSGYAQGDTAARMALRILHGESPDRINIIRKSPNVYMFDYAQFKRFGLKKKDLPKDSIILNEPFPFYEHYKMQIWIISTAFGFLILLVLFLILNIFRRKQAEKALRDSEAEIRRHRDQLEDIVAERTEKLRSANKELEDFAYSVSHDLRAPLRSIGGFAQIISSRHKDDLNEEGRHYFDNIVQASEHMGILIEDLLRYSRLGRKALRSQSVKLGDLLKEISQDLKGRIDEVGAEISIPEDMPVIKGDPTLLNTVFTNLIDNALTYQREGVPVRVIVGSRVEKGSVIVSMSDNGIGISSEYHEKIFNMFQRLHSQDAYPGTGVGLAIVKKSVELLGGDVWVESVVGEGSTFYVKLKGIDD